MLTRVVFAFGCMTKLLILACTSYMSESYLYLLPHHILTAMRIATNVAVSLLQHFFTVRFYAVMRSFYQLM